MSGLKTDRILQEQCCVAGRNGLFCGAVRVQLLQFGVDRFGVSALADFLENIS